MLSTVCVFGNSCRVDAVRPKVTAHLRHIIGGEGQFGEPILRSRRGCFLQFDLLIPADWKARPYVDDATTTVGGEAQNLGVERAGVVEVCDVKADVINAGNARASWLALR